MAVLNADGKVPDLREELIISVMIGRSFARH